MQPQTTETKPEQAMSDLLDFAEMADEQLAKLGKPKGFDEARNSVSSHWLDNPNISEMFTKHYIGLTYGMLMAEIYHSVLNTAAPALALRQKQVETIFNLARYSVLISEQTENPPEPLAQPRLGITGELEPYAKTISELFHGVPRWQVLAETPDTLDDTLNEVDAECLYWAAKAHILSDLAQVFEGGLDQHIWPAACLTAATSMWEHVYREALGLPPALDPKELDNLYRMHSALLNICASGVRDPFLVWKQFQNVESHSSQH